MEIESIIKDSASAVNRKKKQHVKVILTKAYLNKTFTIATIAKEIHTSIPSTTAYINELIEARWLLETETKATVSGRRPAVYTLNPDKRHFIIADINLRTTTLYYINLSHNIKAKVEVEISISDPLYTTHLYENLQSLINEYGSPWAIGLSSPGLIGRKSETNLTYLNHNVDGLSIREWISTKLSTHTFLINDTRASLLGEYRFGYVKKKKNAVLLNLDWGIGLGILTNGTIVNGSDGFAGELGHIQVKPNGKLCHCGKIGCLDTLASASSILTAFNEGLANGQQSLLSSKKGSILLEDILDAANKGDSFAIKITTDAVHELGMGLAIVIHLLNPHTILIDGILSKMGSLLTTTLQQAINQYCINDFKKGIDIVISPLGDLAKVYGTAAYVFDKMVSS